MKNISQWCSNIFSFFYPLCCVSCHGVLQQNELYFCLPCLLHLPETYFHQVKDNPLQYIFMGRVKVENVASLLFYRKGNQVQHILYNLKYKGNKGVGEYLGDYYGRKLTKVDSYRSIDYIIPIPLHKKKLKKRGYNQSEWIAMGLSKGMSKPYLNDILVRTEFTETQTRKNRFSRWENVKEVFQVLNKEKIKGKHLLVCDDVLTTGATMEAALIKLLEVPGVTVSVVTLAAAHK